jgi:hypothetical protein
MRFSQKIMFLLRQGRPFLFTKKKWIKENVAHIARFNLFRVNTKLGAFYPKGISLTQMTKLFGSALKQRAYSSETIQTFNAIKGA